MERKLTRAAEPVRDPVDDVLGRQAVGAAGEPERDHQRAVEEIADADHLRQVDLARRIVASRRKDRGWRRSRNRPGIRSRPPPGSRAAPAPRTPAAARRGRPRWSRGCRRRAFAGCSRSRSRSRSGRRSRRRSSSGSSAGANRGAPLGSSLIPDRRPAARAGAGPGTSRGGAKPVSAQTSAAGSTSSTPSRATPEVEHRDQPEVAQHPDVGRDQRREAGDRRDPRGEHGHPGARVGAAKRLADRHPRSALLLVARAPAGR